MAKYNKFFVALVGVIVSGLTVFFGVDSPWDAPKIVDTVWPIILAAGVYFVPNSE
jgi:type IV secretory pathway VirB2 component (pilin)